MSAGDSDSVIDTPLKADLIQLLYFNSSLNAQWQLMDFKLKLNNPNLTYICNMSSVMSFWKFKSKKILLFLDFQILPITLYHFSQWALMHSLTWPNVYK